MTTSLHLLSAASDDAAGDVIFVHGLNGNPFTTWGLRNEPSWATFLGIDCPELALWLLADDPNDEEGLLLRDDVQRALQRQTAYSTIGHPASVRYSGQSRIVSILLEGRKLLFSGVLFGLLPKLFSAAVDLLKALLRPFTGG